MDKHDLFDAIGDAEDAFLLELEQPKVRRLPRHFGLIAAMLALLLTACAAPAVIRSFDKLHSAQFLVEVQGELVSYPANDNADKTILRIPDGVLLESEVDPEASGTLETVYLPMMLLDHCRIESHTQTDTALTLELSMDLPKYGRLTCASYHQYALPEDGKVTVPGFFGIGEAEAITQTYGDVTALEYVTSGTFADSAGSIHHYRLEGTYIKRLFWSDGFYLYYLKLPLAYPLSIHDVEPILASLAPVEDWSAYLPETP